MRKWKHPPRGATDDGRNSPGEHQQRSTARYCRSKQPQQQPAGGATWRTAATLLTVAITINLTCAGVSSQVCGPPAVPANARVHTEKATDGSGGLKSARYDCDPGYELFGSETIRCDPVKGWDRELPFCGTNVAYRKPVNQSSATRAGPAGYANDGKPGNQNPDGQECSETQKEVSPWWRVDLLTPEAVRVVRITTRGCCGHQPLQDLEIRVGNSSSDLQRNPLCAWYPGTVDEGTTKSFTCARPLIGQYVTVQLVGVESSLSLCEVEVFSNDEFSSDRCASPNLSVETVLTTFAKTCYEFHITRGESFDKARAVCKSHGGDLIHDFRGVTTDYIISELERRKTDLRTQLVWIGAQKEPGITSRTWKWVNGKREALQTWQNAKQKLPAGRGWLWNDVGCNLDYLNYICQHNPLSCGSPEALVNTTIVGRNYTVGANITYQCPVGHSLIGVEMRTCQQNGVWSGTPPACKYVDCGPLPEIEHGGIILSEQRTSFGVQASYTCHENYTLIGNENRTCQASGWSGTQPKCLIDWCPEPPPIQGGRIKVSGRRAGSTALYTCDYGFVLIGEPVLSCGLGGNWTGKIPVCRYVDCGMPARPDRGNMLLLNDSTTVGSVVRYFCDDDYWLVGPQELYCTKDGKWSGSAPACELITCETPHVPPGSYVIGYDYNIHSSIQYHCDPGHILRGEDTLTCLESGQWSGDAPDCEYVDCGPLTPIPFGSHRYTQNTTFLGSEVVYSCANSHRLAGVNRRLCLDTGLWSETAPRCEEIRCTEPTLTPHSFVSVTGNDRMYGRTLIRTSDATVSGAQTFRVGALAKYRCERGYKIVGEGADHLRGERAVEWRNTGNVSVMIVNDAQETNSLGTGIAIGAAIIVILLILIGVLFLHRNKARPVKNTENVQAAEHKEDQNAAVMSYSSLENGRHNFDLTNRGGGLVTFNTFHQSGAGHHPPPPSQLTHHNNNNHLSSSNNNTASSRTGSENIYDQIPSEQFYDAPYEMRTNEEVYEPEPTSRGNIITINGVSVR
uniref:Furrowed n=1 Tax=Anopheles coluzzii TaxID=1518534 RepID=A0A8W7Q5B0_ANOCL